MTEEMTVQKPWGSFRQFTLNEKSTVKLLYINKGKRLSYQYHLHRDEFWKVIRGKIAVTLDGRNVVLEEDGTIEIPKTAKHRIEGLEDSVVLEIATGKFDEDDIVRIEDDYGRIK